MKLEVDAARLRGLRQRIELPLEAAAKLSGLDAGWIEELERTGGDLDIETLRRLGKAYRRNWYVFLLEDEPGRPALPKDFRTLRGGRRLTSQTLSAFDDADYLITKILELPRAGPLPQLDLPRITGRDPERDALATRAAMGVSPEAQHLAGDEYDSVRYWSQRLADAGTYAAQLSFPYRDVRAFCLQRGVALIVVSSQDSPRARAFSMLHELGHLLLGSDAMCRPQPDEARQGTGEEAFCNAFAAAMLMPAEEFAKDPLALALRGRTLELGDAVALARKWGVSELAALRRLASVGYLPQADYQRLHDERAEEFADEPEPSNGRRIRLEHTRMINQNSPLYASEVLDAHARGDIALREVGVLLGGNLKHLPRVRERLGRG
jgi:Zn-dependent peptidase ImmA (M78 family)/transcriptional regulator with XRE-family HTH domain